MDFIFIVAVELLKRKCSVEFMELPLKILDFYR